MHVAVPDRDAAIRVSNRLRPWLPSLLALTANSAVYRNTDTGYASWRSILWQRWPSAGPPPYLESADDYDSVVRMLLATLVRALVMTALEAEQRGDSLAPMAPHALGAAYWKAARYGLDGEVLNGLVDHVQPALEAVGDHDMVHAEPARIAEEGNGAMRQRRAWRRRHDIADVLAEAATATLE